MTPELLALAAAQIKARRDRDPWAQTRRSNQSPPDGDWRTWLLMAGRGFGKTRTGAEFVRTEIMANRARRVALVAPTAADARDVMVEGQSGLLACCDAYGFAAHYKPSLRRVDFANGARATLYSAEEGNRLRGPQHDLAWADELAAWSNDDAWDQLQFGLRLGANPRQVVTTTPRPTPMLKRLIADPATVVTRGSSYDNRDNLAPQFFEQIIAKYRGTRLGQQEIEGLLLEDVQGALWNLAMIDAARRSRDEVPQLARVVVAIDPQAGYDPDGDLSETGIVVAGIDKQRLGWVLADRSGNYSPNQWAERALAAFHEFKADRIVAEANQGGVMVETTLRTVAPRAPITLVRATRGKLARAEPVAALYEQGKVFHAGVFADLEAQMTEYVPETAKRSPDRMDALVWALTHVMLSGRTATLQWV